MAGRPLSLAWVAKLVVAEPASAVREPLAILTAIASVGDAANIVILLDT